MERRSSNGSKRASSQSGGGGGKSRMSSIVSSSRGATLCFASALEAAKRLYLPLFVVQAVIQLLSQLLLHALTNTLSHFSAWFSLIVGTLLLLNVAFLYYSVCVKNQLDAADALQRMPPAWRHLWSTTITLIVVYSLLFILNSVLTITVTFGKEVENTTKAYPDAYWPLSVVWYLLSLVIFWMAVCCFWSWRKDIMRRKRGSGEQRSSEQPVQQEEAAAFDQQQEEAVDVQQKEVQQVESAPLEAQATESAGQVEEKSSKPSAGSTKSGENIRVSAKESVDSSSAPPANNSKPSLTSDGGGGGGGTASISARPLLERLRSSAFVETPRRERRRRSMEESY